MAQEDLAAPPPPNFRLHIAPPRLLTGGEELQFYRAAYDRSPASPTVRHTLASLLLQADSFDEAIALLAEWNLDEFPFLALQVQAHLALETPTGNAAVRRFAPRALARAATDADRAAILTAQARVCIRTGDLATAHSLLLQASTLDPHAHDAFRRLIALDLELDQAGRALDLVTQRLASGDTQSGVIAAKILALVHLGRIEEARETAALDRFVRELVPAPPEGWPTLEAFNTELAAEITTHASLRYGRYGHSSRHTWHVDQPALRRSRIFPALQNIIQREAAAYVAALSPGSHPFVQARPAQAMLQNWCVLTEGEGHETWHLHSNSWLSGTYYAQVPEHIVNGSGPEGCISLGIPEDVVGAAQARDFGERLCRPRPGLMLLFPSYVYHRTYPHRGSGKRICCAFDAEPV